MLSSKSKGCLVGTMAGDALGAAVEGFDMARIRAHFPRGLVDFQHHQRGYGRYTDDAQMALALARSIVENGKVDADQVVKAYAKDFDPYRGYGQNAIQILGHLASSPKADWRTVVKELGPAGGSFANGGAMRIAPVGIAYRNAPADVLYRAVCDAVSCTHTHPVAIDAAYAVAESVGWLSHREAPTSTAAAVSFRSSLFEHLSSRVRTTEMRSRIQFLAVEAGPLHAPSPGTPLSGEAFWEAYLQSPAWQRQWELQLKLAGGQQFQIKADDAVASTLCAFTHHGLLSGSNGCPENAIIAGVHYGGDTDTIAAMCGALVGSLHGLEGVPSRWVERLENNAMGRDAALQLGEQLAQVDCRA